MPKMKTKSSAKKRFKLTGTGKIKRKHGGEDMGSMKTDKFIEHINLEIEKLIRNFE